MHISITTISYVSSRRYFIVRNYCSTEIIKINKYLHMNNLFELYLGSLNIENRIWRLRAFFYHRSLILSILKRKHATFVLKFIAYLLVKKFWNRFDRSFLNGNYRTVDVLRYRVTLSLRYLAGSNVTMRDGCRYMSILQRPCGYVIICLNRLEIASTAQADFSLS